MTTYIFNIGLNRAGTTSLSEALNILGFPTLHHKVMDIRLYDIIRQNISRRQRAFYGVDHLYQGFSDFAGQYFYKDIDRQYPDSRFILTIRELSSWLDSRERKVNKNRANPSYQYQFLNIDREAWTQERENYLSEVHHYFSGRKRSLLVMDIHGGDGWGKLCPFLGVPEPHTSFPRINVSSQ